jgi:hypothetical protein
MRFLRTVFGVGESHRMFQADVLRWKCFAPHPFWEGSRGYALRYKGEIAAFGCVVPCRFLTGSETVASCNVIDWAASKAVPGAGIMLYRHIQGLTGTMINIGGTDEARQVLPRIGFQARAEIHHYTRVLRPWRHFRMADRKDWKSPLRLARDYRELGRAAHHDGGAAKMDAYLLERGRAPAGYFLLSRVGCECRIADLWIHSAAGREWAEAYAAATAAARTDPHITQIAVAASLPLQTGALQRAGYRRTHSEPVFVLDPDRRLGDRNDLAVSLLDNDGFYWSGDGG